MSIICAVEEGYVISHEKFLRDVYKSTAAGGLRPKDDMFAINTPYMTQEQALKTASMDACKTTDRKRKKPSRSTEVPVNYVAQLDEVTFVQRTFPQLITEAKQRGYFDFSASPELIIDNNQKCRDFATEVFQKSSMKGDICPFHGGNNADEPVVATIQSEEYVIPAKSSFYCQDIAQLNKENLKEDCPANGFDLVIIDPPWWNKYIRRRKASNQQSGYVMLRTEDLMQIQLDPLLAHGALVAVWCTNSQSHIDAVHEKLLPSWGVDYVATWYWLKVDSSGTPVSKFSAPPGKQPFERIIFGRKHTQENTVNPSDKLMIVSLPSAVHSHKPPLLDVLKPFLVPSPKVLELFARSLLPGTVSWGLEVLKLQHKFLFCAIDTQIT